MGEATDRMAAIQERLDASSRRWEMTRNAKTGCKLWADGKPRALCLSDVEDSRVSDAVSEPLWLRDMTLLLRARKDIEWLLERIRATPPAADPERKWTDKDVEAFSALAVAAVTKYWEDREREAASGEREGELNGGATPDPVAAGSPGVAPPAPSQAPLLHEEREGYVLCCCGDHLRPAPSAPEPEEEREALAILLHTLDCEADAPEDEDPSLYAQWWASDGCNRPQYYERADRILALRPRSPEPSEVERPAPSEGRWRPIETAPRDGTVVDLWCVTDDPGTASFYFGPTKSGVKDRVQWHGRVTGCWWKDGAWRPKAGLTKLYSLTVEPTHWQPLPAPPSRATPAEPSPGDNDG